MSDDEGSAPMAPDRADRAPAAFIGHGSPMNALERNRYTDGWRAFGEVLGRPRAAATSTAPEVLLRSATYGSPEQTNT